MQDSLLSIESSKTGSKTHESLRGTHPQCLAFDPRNANCAYCGTFGDGLWKTWNRIGNDQISINEVTSMVTITLKKYLF